MQLQSVLDYLSPQNFKNDTLSGLTVAMALVPEAVAFAFVAQVNPMVGLYAAFVIALVTGLLSGRPGMISGATGAVAVVVASLVVQHGVEYLFAAVILAGLIQLAAGALKMGKLAKMIPHPVMLGFVNGLAIVIFLSQIPQFQSSTPAEHWGWMHGTWLPAGQLWLMLGLVGVTMAIIHFLPRLTQAVPSSLVAIVVVTLVVILTQMQTPTVGDMLKGNTLSATLPLWQVPKVALSFETLGIIFPYALIIAGVGLLESLMTLAVINEMTDTRGERNQECLAQGTANVLTGFLGGMGGCAMIGQSMINIQSGGRGRWSSITAGLALLGLILFASPLLEQIPLAALVGVMFMVVIGTFEWSSLQTFGRIPRSDVLILVGVSLVTVMTDLAVAVLLGIVASALVFSWKKAHHLKLTTWTDDEGAKHYDVSGYLFFASAQDFQDAFDVHKDPEEVYVHFKYSRIMDHSGLEAVRMLTEKYHRQGKKLHLSSLGPECLSLLNQAEELVAVNILTKPRSRVAITGSLSMDPSTHP